MHDRVISHSCFAAGCLWFAAVLLIGLQLVCETVWPERWGEGVGNLGIVCAAIAVTINVRGFVNRLSHREHDAFDLGRSVGRNDDPGTVRPLR